MRPQWFVIGLLLLAAVTYSFAGRSADPDSPVHFTPKGELLFPAHYRDWVWLTSGLGMSYSAATENPDPKFDNVFVSPAAYQTFVSTGTWPAGAVFMLEIRSSHNQGSINKSGHYQGDLLDIEAHVKKPDGQWAFYGFDKGNKSAPAIGHDASCYSCHEQHGAVDTTFVQFYPTLLPIAREKKTLNEKELVDNSK